MKIVAHADAQWILASDGDRLLFDVNCSHSFVSYGFTMELSPAERARYENEGPRYLDHLAAEIQDAAPGLQVSRSEYKTRNIYTCVSDALTNAYLQHRKPRED
jgi:hypothetical protein